MQTSISWNLMLSKRIRHFSHKNPINVSNGNSSNGNHDDGNDANGNNADGKDSDGNDGDVVDSDGNDG